VSTKPQRPWWLLVNTPAGLVTQIEDEAHPGQRRFTIRGEPVIQGLTWLTCGPISALTVIALLTAAAVIIDVRTQNSIMRVLFIAAFLGLPALVWGAAVVIANRASARHLEAMKEAEAQCCVVTLSQRNGTLSYTPVNSSKLYQLNYDQIQRVHVTPAIGATDSNAVNLALETNEGTVVLLNEKLGTHAQKADLALEIETNIQNYYR
jgi:hypothetical protein